MDREKLDVQMLFEVLDGHERPSDAVTRAVLQRILYADPSCDRAWELLDAVDGFDGPEDNLVELIEEAESLAASGLWLQARLISDQIRERHGGNPVATAWLETVQVLWQS